MKSKKITVFIPTYNGDKYIGPVIESVIRQELPEGYDLELSITDSGSSDNTVDIIKVYANKNSNIIFNEIPNSEFGHGKTRQSAAEAANGDYILFLSQDATPFNEHWLINMIEPFFISDKVGCVFGRQIPRRQVAPTLKREVSGTFDVMGQPGTIVLQKSGSFITGTVNKETNNFFSDVNSAIRKDLIVKIPFRDVRYSEDQALAKDIQKAGYIKAYSPDGAVEHTNEYTPKEYGHRKFDEYLGLQQSIGYKEKTTIMNVMLSWIKPTIIDWVYIAKDADYSLSNRFKHILTAPLYNLFKELGKFKALRHGNDEQTIAKQSLESRRKKKKIS